MSRDSHGEQQRGVELRTDDRNQIEARIVPTDCESPGDADEELIPVERARRITIRKKKREAAVGFCRFEIHSLGRLDDEDSRCGGVGVWHRVDGMNSSV